jgi:hypothetical protein
MIAERSLGPDQEAALIEALARLPRNPEPPALASFAAVPASAGAEAIPLPRPRTRLAKPTKQLASTKQAATIKPAPRANAPVGAVRQVSSTTSPQPRPAPLIQR